ncbi:hypothetical protein D3C75_1021270 [compost metagenome]
MLVFTSSSCAFTNLSTFRRVSLACLLMRSREQNSSSMVCVCDSACFFAVVTASSTSPHHFTAFFASAKSWSVVSVVFTESMTAKADCSNTLRLLAVTMPVSSMRSAGSSSGAFPTTIDGASANS